MNPTSSKLSFSSSNRDNQIDDLAEHKDSQMFVADADEPYTRLNNKKCSPEAQEVEFHDVSKAAGRLIYITRRIES